MVSYFPILPAIAVLAIVIGALSRYRPHSYPVRAQATRENAQAEASLPKIVQKQSSDVDAVSGATYSYNGIKNAVRQALEKAK
ncbi:MAG: FMN-binding protein [Oscillospiraceae bacterium]|nr:FMN-binding protein [Oscillospiraceae bacterium]